MNINEIIFGFIVSHGIKWLMYYVISDGVGKHVKYWSKLKKKKKKKKKDKEITLKNTICPSNLWVY
jgi:hypothetical protein